MFPFTITLALLVAMAAGAAITVWLIGSSRVAIKNDLEEMENNMALKLADVKAAVAAAAKNNKEAFGEIGTKIADLNKQIADLIRDAGDPDITDEAFLADLEALGVDAKALADVVPGSPTTPT